MGQIRSLIRFSKKATSDEPEKCTEVAFDAGSNTAGGFHLLFDVFCLVIIIYGEINGIIVSEANMAQETMQDRARWCLSMPNDISLNSRWTNRLELLPMALQSIISNDKSMPTDNKLVQKNMQGLATQLAEWLLQLLHAMNDGKASFGEDSKMGTSAFGLSAQHITVMFNCLSAFKNAEQYQEASMWGRLLTTYCL